MRRARVVKRLRLWLPVRWPVTREVCDRGPGLVVCVVEALSVWPDENFNNAYRQHILGSQRLQTVDISLNTWGSFACGAVLWREWYNAKDSLGLLLWKMP